MKRLCAILVLMVLMFGVSSVFAQDSLTEEKVSVSGGGGGVAGSLITVVSPSNAAGGGIGLVTIEEDVAISGGAGSAVSPTRMCVVNAELMGELDRLVVMLKKAEESNDKQSIKGIMEKIRTIKEEIRKDREECEQSPTQTVQAVSERIVKAIPTRVTSIEVRPVYLDKCSELNDWIEKKKHYDILYSLSDEELKNKGYSMGKEEIKKILEELEEGIKKIRVECETSTSGVVSAVRVGAVKPIAIAKPVIAVSGREITDYYKLKISNIMEETNTEQQIKELKGLRTEIDKLIEGLIKSKDEIKTEDISELVTEVKIRPNEIIADNVVIRTTEKNMLIKINRKNLRIKPTKTQVI
ncbi:MAG: hypothetical protein KAU20_02825, partial [Nanoarchaeota archaeon]|nr:hypothetical protein [Nanoarchaeota archaeon]